MTYPLSILNARLRVAYDADLTADPSTYTWTDITTDVDFTFDVDDHIGSSDDSGDSNTKFSATLRNTDAKYTFDNPESTVWPYWGIGTPLEWALDNGDGGGYRVQCITYLVASEVEWTANTPTRCVARIRAAGPFQRLARGKLQSALRRTIPSSKRRKAFWPLEDAAGSKSAASAVSSVGPMQGVPPEFGVASLVPGAFSVAQFSHGQSLTAKLPTPTTSQGVRLSCLLHTTTVPVGQAELFELRAVGGTAERYVLEIGGSQLRFRAYAPGAVEFSGASNVGFAAHQDNLVWLEMDITQTAAGAMAWSLKETTWLFDSNGLPVGSSGFANGTFSGTIGGITDVTIGSLGGFINDCQVGVLALAEQPFPTSGGFAAVLGWAGNTAAGRVKGMCDEFRVPAAVTSTALGSVMGPQIPGSLLDNLRDSENTDHGILTDHAGRVEYTALSELYNRTPALTLRANVRGEIAVVVPQVDDQSKANVASASRTGGSTATVRDDADIQRHGEYERAAITVNLANDGPLFGHAGWALAHGRGEHYDIKQLTIRPHVAGAGGAALGTTLLALRLGDRIVLDPAPRQMAKGPIELMIRGRTQKLPGMRSRTAWEVTYDLIPCEPYNAYSLNSDRLDTAGTEVWLAATSAATTVTVQTTVVTPAVTGSTSIDLWAAGEKVTLTSVTDEAYGDDFTRTTANGWGSMPASTSLPAQAWTVVLGTGTVALSDLATNGSQATMNLQAAGSNMRCALNGLPMRHPVARIDSAISVAPTGAGIFMSVQYRRGTGTSIDCYEASMEVPAGGGAPILSLYAPGAILIAQVVLSSVTPGPGVFYSWRVMPVGDRHRINVWQLGAPEPGSWSIDTRDNTRLRPGPIGLRSGRLAGNTNAGATTTTWDALALVGVQRFGLTRSVLGFSKALPIGSQVRLWKGRGLGV